MRESKKFRARDAAVRACFASHNAMSTAVITQRTRLSSFLTKGRVQASFSVFPCG